MVRSSLPRQDPLVLWLGTVGSAIALRSIVSLLFLPIPERMPPFGFFLILSFLSLGLFNLLQRVRRRRVLDLVLSFVGITFWSVGIIRWIWQSSASVGWLGFPSSMGFLDGYAVCLIVFSGGAHWSLGLYLSRMDTSHTKLLLRFDGGIGMMLFISFLRWGIKMEDPYVFQSVGLYILIGLVALYRAKKRELNDPFQHPKSLLRSVGVFLLLGSVTLGIAILSVPLLTYSADTLYRTTYIFLSPLGPYLIRILRFLLGFTFARPSEPVASSGAAVGDVPAGIGEPTWLGLIAKLLGWGSLGVLGVLGMGILVFLLKLLIQTLFQTRGEGQPFSLVLKLFFHELTTYVRIFLNRILSLFRHYRSKFGQSRNGVPQTPIYAMEPSFRSLYREVSRSLKTLYRVGTLLGIKRQSSETLRQYVSRVEKRFPKMGKPGATILLETEQFWYGPRSELTMNSTSTQSLKELGQARRSLWMQVPPYLLSFGRRDS
ncbi:MAG: hypothetical protein N2442_09145 [Spirochaetes bacterium]|nr:hypothetical protein [Spirochaetota bacterium]